MMCRRKVPSSPTLVAGLKSSMETRVVLDSFHYSSNLTCIRKHGDFLRIHIATLLPIVSPPTRSINVNIHSRPYICTHMHIVCVSVVVVVVRTAMSSWQQETSLAARRHRKTRSRRRHKKRTRAIWKKGRLRAAAENGAWSFWITFRNWVISDAQCPHSHTNVYGCRWSWPACLNWVQEISFLCSQYVLKYV